MSNGTHIVVISLIGGEKLKQEYKTQSAAQRQLNLLLKKLNEPGIWFLKINREIINIDRIHRKVRGIYNRKLNENNICKDA